MKTPLLKRLVERVVVMNPAPDEGGEDRDEFFDEMENKYPSFSRWVFGGEETMEYKFFNDFKSKKYRWLFKVIVGYESRHHDATEMIDLKIEKIENQGWKIYAQEHVGGGGQDADAVIFYREK